MSKLSGKTALVTGASRDTGRASALGLAAAGAQVLLHYGRGAKDAETVVEQIHKAGGRAAAVCVELADPDGPHRLAKQVRGIIGDRLDILVANTGIANTATIEETTIADFDGMVAVDVRAPFFLVQQFLPIMCKGSSIVFVLCPAPRSAVGALSAYAVMTGAIDAMVKHFASVLGPRGIRVNAIAPGFVETVTKRQAQPDDVGPAVAFLASDDARRITGGTLRLDGGSTL